MTLTIHTEEDDKRQLNLKIEVSEDQVEKAMDKHDIDIVSLAVSAEPKYKSLAKLLERRRFVLMDDIYMKYL